MGRRGSGGVMVGSEISHYRILSRIGAGGMGLVYKAEDTRLQRVVALKVLPPHSLQAASKARFLQEARAAAQLHHPNICPVYEVDEADGQLFYTMAFLEGWPLSALIQRGPLPLGLALEIAIQVANGLEQAHRRGVVHRDIKPHNIIIGENGHASILDFGLAIIRGETRMTNPGRTLGTASYMSPEQATGAPVDQRSDVWSLGVVLYEMVAGERPFQRDQDAAVLHAIVHQDPKPVSEYREGVPEELRRAILRALEKSPDNRWQTAGEFSVELGRIVKMHVPPEEASSSQGIPESLRPEAASIQGMDSEELTLTDFARSPDPPCSDRKPQLRRSHLVGIGIALATFLFAALGWMLFLRPGGPWTVLRLPEEKRVAILPFEVFGGDAALRALSDGLADTLTSELSQLERFQGKLMVVPASEIRGREIRSAEDARKRYAANLVVTGSTQRIGDQVQLTLNLVDAAELRQLGARTFYIDIKNPSSLRTGAITRLTSLLEIPFGEAQIRVVEAGKSLRGGAHLAYLEGRGFLSRYDQEGNLDHAIERFTAATTQDQDFALAYAGLAEAYWRKTVNTEQKQWIDLATANAEKAVALAPALPVTRVTLGDIYAYRGKHAEAVEQFQQALTMAPGSAEARRGLADVYTAEGRYKEAEQAYIEAVRQRPQDWLGHLLLGYFYIQRSRYVEAERALRIALKLTPDNAIVYRNLAVVYMCLGRYPEAREQLEIALRLRPNAVTYGSLGVAFYYEGRFPEAVSALETSIDLDPNDYVQWGNLGTAYRWAPGGSAKATAALRRAIELGEAMLVVTPKDYRVYANLAEYHAKLGERGAALRRIAEIPPAVRSSYAFRIALAYELLGDRVTAIRTLQSLLNDSSVLNDIRYDPDLAGLWKDPAFQQAMRELSGKIK